MPLSLSGHVHTPLSAAPSPPLAPVASLLLSPDLSASSASSSPVSPSLEVELVAAHSLALHAMRQGWSRASSATRAAPLPEWEEALLAEEKKCDAQ